MKFILKDVTPKTVVFLTGCLLAFKRLDGHNINTIFEISDLECVTSCLSTSGCMSVEYRPSNSKCITQDTDSTNVVYDNDNHWNIYEPCFLSQ